LLNVVLRMIARSSPSAKAQATLAAMPVVTLVAMLAVTPVATPVEMLAATLVEMLAAPPTLLQHLLPLPLRQPPLPVTPVETPVAMLVAMLETTAVPELPRHPLLRPSKRPLLLVARTRLDAVVAEVAEAASDADEDDLLRATTLHDLDKACDDYGQ
jgi:hypothetical protein